MRTTKDILSAQVPPLAEHLRTMQLRYSQEQKEWWVLEWAIDVLAGKENMSIEPDWFVGAVD